MGYNQMDKQPSIEYSKVKMVD